MIIFLHRAMADTLPSVLSSIVARRYAQHGTFEFRTAGPSKGFEWASISIESPFSWISWFDRLFLNIGWSKNRANWTLRKLNCAALALFSPSVSWVFETRFAELLANSRCRLMTMLANFWWMLRGKRSVFSSQAQFIFCIRVWAILAGQDLSSLFRSQSLRGWSNVNLETLKIRSDFEFGKFRKNPKLESNLCRHLTVSTGLAGRLQ